jgi:hypothetical protein
VVKMKSMQCGVSPAVVGDIYHHIQLYLAASHDDGRDRASLVTRDGVAHTMRCDTNLAELNQALVTSYLMRPAERFEPLAEQRDFLRVLAAPSDDGTRLGRIGVDFGSVSLCHVAAGFTEATLEFAKGFAIWDLAPGTTSSTPPEARFSASTAIPCPSTTA